MSDTSGSVLQAVSERILAAYLEKAGYSAVHVVSGRGAAYGSPGVDITYRGGGATRRVKVKADAYFGTDQGKVFDRSRPFYRSDAGHYAFESISNTKTREPGWMFNSEANELFYYYIVLSQTEDEANALLAEPDEVLFSELSVDRDELRILPMRATRNWFEAHYEEYTPRPVTLDDHVAWYRLIPRQDIDGAVEGIKLVGPVFSELSEG
jgi:hypothetical protein